MSEDFRIIDRCLAGEQQAFGELIDRHKEVVFSLACGMLGNAEEAEDITQEAFIKAYRSLAGFRREASFRNWVCRIATRLCLDYLRAHREERKRKVSFEEKEPMIAGPETLLAGQTEIAAAFQNLPAQFRTILSLRHLQELSYQEIADLLQLPLGTVKTHLRRGRAALKKELEKLRREESPPLRGYKEA